MDTTRVTRGPKPLQLPLKRWRDGAVRVIDPQQRYDRSPTAFQAALYRCKNGDGKFRVQIEGSKVRFHWVAKGDE